MEPQISLKEAEKRVFRTAFNDGLWDIFLGCILLIFAVAPLLSERLGDFWSSMIFLPFWGLVYLAIWAVRRTMVAPRIGEVRFGPARRRKLAKFTLTMALVNLALVGLGVIAAAKYASLPGLTVSIAAGLALLLGFSAAAALLDIPRLYVYGLLAGFSPPVGAWLWSQGAASHHGFPLTFGITSGIIILTGLALFFRLLSETPAPSEGTPPSEA